MNTLDFPEPPTESTVSEARRALQTQRQELSQLSDRITSAEDALAQIVADKKRTIREMQREQNMLEEKIKHTLAYISPIRRLPHELLRHIFMFNFDNHPCCAWILASVCVQWRRLALSVPRLWSKVSDEFSLTCAGSECVFHSPHLYWRSDMFIDDKTCCSPNLSLTDTSLEIFVVNTPCNYFDVLRPAFIPEAMCRARYAIRFCLHIYWSCLV